MKIFQKKMRQIPKRLIAAAIVFLVPTIVEFALNVIDEDVQFANCVTNAEPDTISKLYIDKADTYVALVEQSMKEEDLSNARRAVFKLKDESLKGSYSNRLDKVAKSISNKKESQKKVQTTTPKTNNFNNSNGNVSGNNKFPYYSQCDSRWKNISTSSGNYNTCGCGCGYSSLAMVLSGLKGDASITPKTVVPYVIKFSASKCAISDDALYSSKLETKYGITPKVIFNRSSNLSASKKKDKIVAELKKGKPIVLLIPGHYIALTSINGNKITVLDPGNSANNGNYTIDKLYSKYYNHKNRCSSEGKCGFIFAISYSK